MVIISHPCHLNKSSVKITIKILAYLFFYSTFLASMCALLSIPLGLVYQWNVPEVLLCWCKKSYILLRFLQSMVLLCVMLGLSSLKLSTSGSLQIVVGKSFMGHLHDPSKQAWASKQGSNDSWADSFWRNRKPDRVLHFALLEINKSNVNKLTGNFSQVVAPNRSSFQVFSSQ